MCALNVRYADGLNLIENYPGFVGIYTKAPSFDNNITALGSQLEIEY